MNFKQRIALGTVQFGQHYGVGNRSGQVDQIEMASILEYAWTEKIDTLDTAITYGESEERLGKVGVGQWKIITKLPLIPESCKDIAGYLNQAIVDSLQRLNVKCLYGLLFHAPRQLLESSGDLIYRTVSGFKEEGLVQKIGISIYNPEELVALLPRFQFDLVQAPFNILDRRMLISGWLHRLKKMGIEVHIRSIFLQGLLLMPKQDRPVAFHRWQSLWDVWDEWLHESAVTPLQACLNFVLSCWEVDRVVVGVDCLKHLQQIIMSTHYSCLSIPDSIVSQDLNLINPSYWKKA